MDYAKILSTWWSGNCYHLEQLQAIINSPDVKSYAYILHDKCLNDNGELKKPHYHFLLQLQRNQRGAWFKAFATDDMGIVFAQPTRDPLNAFNYLIHDTDKCRKENKYLYDASARISTIDDFTGDAKENENVELVDDVFALAEHKITWIELLRKKPKRIHMIGNISKATELIRQERYPYDYQPRPEYPRPQPTQPPRRPIELRPIKDDNMPF